MRPALLALVVVACNADAPRSAVVTADGGAPTTGRAAAETKLGTAVAQITPLGQNNVSGNLSLTQEVDGVRFEGEVRGLAPKSAHGFHVHEVGDCSAPDGSSAGAHFNPHQGQHGGLQEPNTHIGDLGNIEADAQGVAKVSVVKRGATLSPGPTGVIGRAVIVHQNPDDFKTQPTGNSGGRIACGVINLSL